MREKVLSAAQELGYRPNILARSLIQQQSKIVGVISGYMEHPFFIRSLERLAFQLSPSGLRLLVFTAENDTSVDRLVDEMLSYQVNAVLLWSVSVSSTLATECARAGIPVILMNPTLQDAGAIEVLGDNDVGAQAIAQRFVDTGRRRIAFMAGYSGSPTSMVREKAFMAFFAERGLPPPRRVVGNYQYDDAASATRSLFAREEDRPDAVFCANDLMAVAVIEILRSEFGLEPGRDCSVAGFDNLPMASWPSYSLTTYSQPIDGLTDKAVRIITGVDEAVIGTTVVAGQLIIRKTA